MKKIIFSMLILVQTFVGLAQKSSGISGKIIDSKTQKPLENVVTSIQNVFLTQLTDFYGNFKFNNVPIGKQLLQIKSQGYKELLLQIDVEEGKILEFGTIVLEEDAASEQLLSSVTISETELNSESNSSESTLGLLQSSRDTFLQAAAFNFGQARFSVRGIDNEYANVMINGVSMNKTADGRPQYGDWGGLNDATRNQEFTNGSAPSDYVFGGIAGTQEINTRASIYRPGTRISFLNTNTNYSYRVMATQASGMNSDGWTYVISAGRRWTNKGYFEGTNYGANSLFASVEKRINENHSLNLTSIYATNIRDKNSPNTNEVVELAGEKYNSYWGFQDGKRRNSRFKKSGEPMLILTHYWKINPKTNLNTTVSYQTGEIGNSRLEGNAVDNPDPTYYKKLPSYWTSLHTNDGVFIPNAPAAIASRAIFLDNKQINWNTIYAINKQNSANGSRTVLYEDRNDEDIITGNLNLTSQLSDNIFISAAVNYQDSKTKNFKNMLDLLGGIYYVDKINFGFGSQQQSDLNNPNRQVVVNDRYGYNYDINVTKFDAFTQFKFTYKKIDFYMAQTFSQSVYQREGFYKNGYHPTNSFGKSEEKVFENFGFKGGLTLKLTGRHLLDINGIYMTKAPNAKDVFPNARVNNSTTENLTPERIKGFDASYIIRAPKFKARFTGFYNETLNSTDINFYYADGQINVGNINNIQSIGAFVSEVVTGINKKNRGIEVGLEYQLTSTIKLTGVAAYGDFVYTNNPNLKIFDDSGLIEKNDKGETKLAGLKLSGMPQQAYSFGIEYRDPKFWWVGVNANYLSDTHLDVSALKRTGDYFDFLPTESPALPIVVDQAKADAFLKQEKFKAIQLLNLVGGKSWRIKGKTLGLFVSINNILDFSYRTGGFEQSRSADYRADVEDTRSGGVGPFGAKYFQGFGRTYSANIYLQF